MSGRATKLITVYRLITQLLLALWGLSPEKDPPPRVLLER